MSADKQGQRKCRAKLSGHGGAAVTRSEHPDFRVPRHVGCRFQWFERIVVRQVVVQVGHDLIDLVRVGLWVYLLPWVRQRSRGQTITTRGAAHAQVDSSRVKYG